MFLNLVKTEQLQAQEMQAATTKDANNNLTRTSWTISWYSS